MGREGVTPSMAKAALRRSNTLIAAMLLRRGDADAMLCGLVGRFDGHLQTRARHHRPAARRDQASRP